jgi:hypothetical protein
MAGFDWFYGKKPPVAKNNKSPQKTAAAVVGGCCNGRVAPAFFALASALP